VTPSSSGTYKVIATNATTGTSIALTDMSTVTVNQIPASPEMPSGAVTITIPASNTYEYLVNPVDYAENYTWSISPSAAGSILGNTTSASVTWSDKYTGDAYITVLASNLCGTSSSLQALKISMTKSSIATDVSSIGSPVNGSELWNSEFLNKNPNAEISIFDINGRLISKFKGSENNNLQSALTGTYLYIIDLKDGSASLKGKFAIVK